MKPRAVSVTRNMKIMGKMSILLFFPAFASQAATAKSATAAKSWLAEPNIGHITDQLVKASHTDITTVTIDATYLLAKKLTVVAGLASAASAGEVDTVVAKNSWKAPKLVAVSSVVKAKAEQPGP